MSDFEELALPAEENISVDDYGKWFVTIKFITLTNSGMLTTGGLGIEQAARGGDHTRFYFDNEIQAFSVSWLYYTNYGIPYPYMDEWEDAKNNEFNNQAATGAGTFSESEVMEFI